MDIETEINCLWEVIFDYEKTKQKEHGEILPQHWQDLVDDAKGAVHFIREVLDLESEMEKAKREEAAVRGALGLYSEVEKAKREEAAK